jgi:uncharacterized protein
MLSKLLPKQENFFILFQKVVNEVAVAAEQFLQLVKNLEQSEEYAKIIAKHETEGDLITLATFDLLHKTFITPFDRNDIHQLTRKLDDILDTTNRTAQRIALYKIQKLPDSMRKLADLGLGASASIKVIVKKLENLKYTPEIIEHCNAISEADSEAEHIMLAGVGELFAKENDFKYLLKTKEIFEYCKAIIGEYRDVADIIKGIVLEYS